MSFINVEPTESMMIPPDLAPPAAAPRPPDAKPLTPDMTRRASAAGNSSTAPSGAGSLSDALETTNRMFEILSSRSDIDHPICTECTELLVDGLGKRLAVATRERDAYVDYLRRANSSVPSPGELRSARSALSTAQAAEAAALAELESLEREKASLDAALASEEAASRECDASEHAFWHERNTFAISLSRFTSDRDALLARHAHDADVLTGLQRRSVYNDTFNITHDNHFATINGLRLGRLASPFVDWPELNAAWGQTCLLLATLAERLAFKFQGYELCPMGSTSSIVRLETKQGDARSAPTGTSHPGAPSSTAAATPPVRHKLDLFSSGDFPINFGFTHRKIDAAMVAFLECLRQLGEFVEASGAPPTSTGFSGGSGAAAGGGGGMKLPYEIRRDRIHGESIKLSTSRDEQWTKACKYTLTCCKFLLAHANNMESGGGRRVR